ncbi:GNAT family N-acetyltransferase [Nonomuraea fuscirosea]|uniref:GNAT family N-acetyltransferase n=1 Tax=Nonomuraea fuscirosea TaxID=1291556 RepID=UPI0034359EA2
MDEPARDPALDRGTAAGDLTRAVAFLHAFARRRAPVLRPVPGGFAVLDDRYPGSYDDNRLIIREAPDDNGLLAREPSGDNRLLAREASGDNRLLAREASDYKGLLAREASNYHRLLAREASDGNGLIVRPAPGDALERTAELLMAAADEALATRAHRLVCIDDDQLGTACAPAFAAAGYEHETNLVMVFRGPIPTSPAPAPPSPASQAAPPEASPAVSPAPLPAASAAASRGGSPAASPAGPPMTSEAVSPVASQVGSSATSPTASPTVSPASLSAGSAAASQGGSPAASPAGLRAVEVLGLEEVVAVLRRDWRESLPEASDETIDALARRAEARLRGADTVGFRGVRAPDGEIAARADLYVHGGVAQTESVFTAEAYRGKGYARTLMNALLAEAAEAELIFLLADADDWPRHFYTRLGFETVGRTHAFLRT